MSDFRPTDRAFRSADNQRGSFGSRNAEVATRGSDNRGRGLDVQERMLIEQRVTNDGKSTGVAYLLWLFLGGLGGHRFYLGLTHSAFLMLALWIVGIATVFIGIGILPLAIVGIWSIIDAFRIPKMIRQQKDAMRTSLSENMYA